MNARVAIVAGLLLIPSLAAAETASHPLLDFARERAATKKHSEHNVDSRKQLLEAEHALEQGHVPPDADCAGSLGAQRYAYLYTMLAGARAATGDHAGAAVAYRSAHACRPRDADILAALGGALFDSRDYAAARVEVDAALAIDGRSVASNRLAGNIAFVDERWADAVARFRYVAASDPDRVQAGYGQLMLWLAQARAGVPHPEYETRAPSDGWPQPLLLYMIGQYTEQELVARVAEGDENAAVSGKPPATNTDERLCEALFYVGESYRARGDRAVARDYFAALVNLRVLYFVEHGLALAEIGKMGTFTDF